MRADECVIQHLIFVMFFIRFLWSWCCAFQLVNEFAYDINKHLRAVKWVFQSSRSKLHRPNWLHCSHAKTGISSGVALLFALLISTGYIMHTLSKQHSTVKATKLQI